ncbi:MAG: hypothetical protein RR342_01040 [Bacilli bacterium]|jgi:hypothetical protein
MAVKLNDGRYLNVCLEGCYANSKGVFVNYSQYSDEKAREFEKDRINEFNKFVNDVDTEMIKYREELEKYVTEHNIKTVEELKDLPEEIQNKINIVETIQDDIVYISNGLYNRIGLENPTVKNIKNYKLLKEFGFKDTWFTNRIEIPVSITRVSSVLNNQKFTYTDMYKELKKIVKKDGYTDC